GTPASLSPAVAEIDERVGASADIRWVRDLSQPVTFGVRRPVVLLPAVLHDMSTDVQRAVVAHELIHVIRRDWVWVVAEEVVRVVLWFHPAIWWLLARVQLAREQVVDADAVRLLGARRPYMEALLTCADQSAFVPVPAFARRRELFQRLTQLSRDVEMSRTRLLASFVVLALALVVAGRYTVAAFPLHAPPAAAHTTQASSMAKAQGLRKIMHVDPQYPPDVPLEEVRGVMTLNITVDERGSVIDAQVVSTKVDGPSLSAGGSDVTADVAKAIRAAALQWKYEPLEQPMATFVSVPFGNRTSPLSETLHARGNVEIVQKNGERVQGDEAYYRTDTGELIVHKDNGRTVVRPKMPFDSNKPLRVGGAVKQPKKIHNVNPLYPVEAQAARAQGIVILETTIGTDGKVTHARVVKSIPMLDRAALDAVTQWEYTPTMLNGVAVPVLVTVTVNFTLR
ncbi:MAG: TonB family protein, partial [Vicinamibacteraceae bacterium]